MFEIMRLLTIQGSRTEVGSNAAMGQQAFRCRAMFTMSVQAAMVSGQLGIRAEAEPASDSSGQLAAIGTPAGPESWQQEKQKLVETVAVLEKHKDWADKKIGQLIKRVTEAERTQKDEAYRLRDEVCDKKVAC